MTERDRAIALYTFLKEFVQLRTRTIRDVSRYEQDGQVIWAADIRREHGCHCIAWHRVTSVESGNDAADEVWIEIRKPRLTRPPEPPESVQPWVRCAQLDDSSIELPDLFPTLPGATADDHAIKLDDCPEVREAWDAYIESRWWPWAEQDRRERVVQDVYTALFSVLQRQQRLGDAPDGRTVRRHLVAAQVTVSSTRNAELSPSHPQEKAPARPLNRTCCIHSTVPIHGNCARSRRRWRAGRVAVGGRTA